MTIISRDIQNGFRHLLESNSFIDLLLKVDQQDFAAHRCLLGAVSCYFRSLLSQEPYAGVNALPVVFTIEGLGAEEMDLLLASLYGALTVEEVAKMGKLEALNKAAHALQCPAVMEACQGVMAESKHSAVPQPHSDGMTVSEEELLVPSSGHDSWLDDSNIAAYEVTDYAPADLLCPSDDAGEPDDASEDGGASSGGLDLPSGPTGPAGGLGSSELVLSLPQDAIRVVNDRDAGAASGLQPEPPGLPESFLSGIVCLCGRGRSGQASACQQVPAGSRNMRVYACRCPCYRAGLPCNDNCRCKGCRNPHGLNPHLFPPMVRRTKEQKACYCGYRRPGQPAETREAAARHCAEPGTCLCRLKGRPCTSLCRCRSCKNPEGRRRHEPGLPMNPDRNQDVNPERNQAVNPDRDQAVDPDRNSTAYPDRNPAANPDRNPAMYSDRSSAPDAYPDRTPHGKPDRNHSSYVASYLDRNPASYPDRKAISYPNRNLTAQSVRNSVLYPQNTPSGSALISNPDTNPDANGAATNSKVHPGESSESGSLPSRFLCRCPPAETLKKNGKHMAGQFCSQSSSDRDLCRRLGLPFKCSCLVRARSCSADCPCRTCSNRLEVRHRRSVKLVTRTESI